MSHTIIDIDFRSDGPIETGAISFTCYCEFVVERNSDSRSSIFGISICSADKVQQTRAISPEQKFIVLPIYDEALIGLLISEVIKITLPDDTEEYWGDILARYFSWEYTNLTDWNFVH